jgi:tRNA threonylcarbamoyladenosine biosynthesis protein TsaB
VRLNDSGLLAIDTSAGTAVAVLVDGVVASESYDANSMQHAEQIGIQIQQVLEAAKKKSSDVTAVAVGVGPGPFTGLRVGIAAAKMFAEGVSAPIYGVGSLDAIAFANSLDQPTLVLTDARRSEVFFGLYQGKTSAGVPKALLGPGVKKQAELEVQLKAAGHNYLLANTQVSAANLGLLALAQLAEGTANTSVVANYLRAPDAVPAKGKKVSG